MSDIHWGYESGPLNFNDDIYDDDDYDGGLSGPMTFLIPRKEPR